MRPEDANLSTINQTKEIYDEVDIAVTKTVLQFLAA